MANSDTTPSIPPPAPLSVRKENAMPINPKIAELTESRQELLNRMQNLKQDLQNWRVKLDTQVKVYRDELLELKKSLNTEVEQLRSEFKELRTTLQQQQEDVTASLRNLGLQDDSGETKAAETSKNEENSKDVGEDLPKDNDETLIFSRFISPEESRMWTGPTVSWNPVFGWSRAPFALPLRLVFGAAPFELESLHGRVRTL